DKGCIVLQKPPGLTCQLSKSKEATGDSLNNFNALLKGLGRTFGKQPVPVHRLDKGTTGALVLGRSSTHARNLSQQFQTRTVEKTYLALVRGGVQTFPTKCGEIRTPIHYKDGRASIDHSSNGKPSITEWEVVSSSPSAPLTLLRLKLHTGHKHQLRVHLAFCLGAPILGDTLYSRKPIAKAVRDISIIPEDRIYLHASHVSFFQYRSTGPKKRLRLGITAPLPSDFLKICSDSGIQVDPLEVKGGVWVDNVRITNERVSELEGHWQAGRI
ncbi:2,3-dihydroxybenzoate decarboxylase, partial [Termitomyces sp. T112]